MNRVLFCDGCQFLSLTEEQQSLLREQAKKQGRILSFPEEFHYCLKYGKRVMHNLQHPKLPRILECQMMDDDGNEIWAALESLRNDKNNEVIDMLQKSLIEFCGKGEIK